MIKEKYCPGHPFIEAVIQDALNYDYIVIDCFCGIGGFTEGFERTGKYKIIACINHWDVALNTHCKNHPLCLHIEEDFRTAHLELILYMVNKIRLLKPSIQVHGSFGLECTNFSNAKGGMPRDNDSRTLADHVDRYEETFHFDVMWIENVKEFLLWGPMIPKVLWETDETISWAKRARKKKKRTIHFNPDKHDADIFLQMPGAYCPLHIQKKKKKVVSIGPWPIPDPERKALDFNRWRAHIKSYGFDSSHKLLNAADYGVPQHRIRLIMQFTRKGVPAYWPKPTHNKKGLNGLPKWLPIGPCLDLEDEGTELLSFETGKDGTLKPRITSPKTIQRLMKGCLRHVLNGESQFITKYMGNDQHTGVNNGKSIHEESNTLATSNRVALVSAKLVDFYFGNGYTKPIHEVSGAMRTKDPAGVYDVNLLHSRFLDIRYSSGKTDSSLEEKSPALLANPKQILINVDQYGLANQKFIDQQYSAGDNTKGLQDASGAAVINPKQALINVDRYIMDTQFNNEACSLEDTARTITANRKYYYIINAAWFEGHCKSITEPSATLIARQDKMPQYLVVTETGELAIEVYPHDPPHYVAMKRFMADHGIVSIKMRMLKDTEMLRIQSFDPAKTKLAKSTTDNKKMIGNAVPPKLIEALATSHDDGWNKFKEVPVAA